MPSVRPGDEGSLAAGAGAAHVATSQPRKSNQRGLGHHHWGRRRPEGGLFRSPRSIVSAGSQFAHPALVRWHDNAPVAGSEEAVCLRAHVCF